MVRNKIPKIYSLAWYYSIHRFCSSHFLYKFIVMNYGKYTFIKLQHIHLLTAKNLQILAGLQISSRQRVSGSGTRRSRSPSTGWDLSISRSALSGASSITVQFVRVPGHLICQTTRPAAPPPPPPAAPRCCCFCCGWWWERRWGADAASAAAVPGDICAGWLNKGRWALCTQRLVIHRSRQPRRSELVMWSLL